MNKEPQPENLIPEINQVTHDYYDYHKLSQEERLINWKLRWSWIVSIHKFLFDISYISDSKKKAYRISRDFQNFKLVGWVNVFNGIKYTFEHTKGFFFDLYTQINRSIEPEKFRLICLFYHQIDSDTYMFFNQFYSTVFPCSKTRLKKLWIDEPELPEVTLLCYKNTKSIYDIISLFRRIELLSKNYFDLEYRREIEKMMLHPPVYKDEMELEE